ncbi:tumor necrosis factor receptor superfamily member 14-like isoform X2 [Polypterus senegalus]|uniref:tumor necrosis factor receptor superfamily member 14-like isoform X2 n=1 Tax=Polypterus senegalus TaxID=55291 RepID=UPI0019645A77|nr:tumor necrosis factor receptor superfamily member 14-like isoform X2 [Polypterus senegalus]XP_039611885.1 tumor necrosis factor receptor superfamily member 14-like isoform X2 [Polypterus senegalus]XP_039611886.1 tumor necrosis factor receptor superfamily member 14-like isoform X2 [Polypterus senegalus]XP_039611887.1 tumor necrosis factor receptor superfamily member 14-like isoform X2 [Polypterus senegalus]
MRLQHSFKGFVISPFLFLLVQFLIIYEIMRPQQNFKGFVIILPLLFHLGTGQQVRNISIKCHSFMPAFLEAINQLKMLIILQSFIKKAFACEPAEYFIQGECCPMCSSGSRVYKHCTADSSTVCVPCVDKTYTDHPNGLPECEVCRDCDEGLALMKIQECTPTSNTICSVLPGYFCIGYSGGSCTIGQKHQSCSPGQFISRKGNAKEDTQCEDCPKDTYSNGTLTKCKQHTSCKSLGLKEKNPGTRAMDAECSEHSNTAAIVTGVIVLAIILIIGVIIFLKKKNIHKGLHNLLHKPQQETNQERVVHVSADTEQAMPINR